MTLTFDIDVILENGPLMISFLAFNSFVFLFLLTENIEGGVVVIYI